MSIPIILINPPTDSCDTRLLPTENLMLGYLISVLRAEQLPFTVIDADMEAVSATALLQQIATLEPVGVVLLLMYRNLRSGLTFARQLGNLPNSPKIIGCGYAATLSASQLLDVEPELDALVIGETEQTILEIARAWQNGSDWEKIPGLMVRDAHNSPKLSGVRPLIRSLDTLPFPARDYLVKSLEHTPIAEVLTSRGCYAQCSFCNIPLLQANNPGPRWRGRSPENVVGEVIELYEKFGIRQIEFADENFIGPGRAGRIRAQAIAELIRTYPLPITFQLYCRVDDIEEGLFETLKSAGVRAVNFGLESANQRLLDRFNKRITLAATERGIAVLQRLGIRPMPSFIMFEPTTTLAELRINLQFLRQHQFPALINPTTIIPFRAAPLTEILAAENLLSSDRFILAPFIGDVEFHDPRVADIKTKWENWQKQVNTCYDQMLAILSRAYHAALDLELSADVEWQSLWRYFTHLKWVESGVIHRLISAQEKSAPICQETLEQNSQLVNLHQQTFTILSQQPLIARRLGVNV